MTYLYKCEKCNKTIEIRKPMSEVSKVEHCETCGNELKRDYKGSAAIYTNDKAKY